jgi:sugar phosphate isomerase/epimerase
MAAKLALQLYTLRHELKHDYPGIMKRVAEAGYAGVEPAGFPGSSLQEASGIYRDLGLTVCSAHTRLPVGDDRDAVFEELRSLGTARAVSGLGPDHFQSREAIRASCEQFNQAAEAAGSAGMTFSIHNHWWEFETLEGRPVYQYMLEDLDPSVLFEVDVYWVQTGGQDAAQVLRELGPRAPLLHIKDGPCEQGKPMTAVGSGKVDIPGVAAAAKNTAEWFIVELDACATDMVEAVEESARYLREAGLVEGR